MIYILYRNADLYVLSMSLSELPSIPGFSNASLPDLYEIPADFTVVYKDDVPYSNYKYDKATNTIFKVDLPEITDEIRPYAKTLNQRIENLEQKLVPSVQFGHLAFYHKSVKLARNVVRFFRVYVEHNIKRDKMQTVVVKPSDFEIQMGVYSSVNNKPDTLLSSSDITNLVVTKTPMAISVSLDGGVLSSGIYWLAIWTNMVEGKELVVQGGKRVVGLLNAYLLTNVTDGLPSKIDQAKLIENDIPIDIAIVGGV